MTDPVTEPVTEPITEPAFLPEGAIAYLNPAAIVEDLSSINGIHEQTPVDITGSAGIISLAGHSNINPDGVSVSIKEEDGKKFLRYTNELEYTYSQLYINLDPSVFTESGTYYFSLTFRFNEGYACNDTQGRALLARLVDTQQNNYTVITKDELSANDYSEWTTVNFSITAPNAAPTVLRVIIFADPGDYIDIQSLAIYDKNPTGDDHVTDPVKVDFSTLKAGDDLNEYKALLDTLLDYTKSKNKYGATTYSSQKLDGYTYFIHSANLYSPSTNKVIAANITFTKYRDQQTTLSDFIWAPPEASWWTFEFDIEPIFATNGSNYQKQYFAIYYKLLDKTGVGYCVDIIDLQGKLVYRCPKEYYNLILPGSLAYANTPLFTSAPSFVCLSTSGAMLNLSENTTESASTLIYEENASMGYQISSSPLSSRFEDFVKGNSLLCTVSKDSFSFINAYDIPSYYSDDFTVSIVPLANGKCVFLPKSKFDFQFDWDISLLEDRESPRYSFDNTSSEDINAGEEFVVITRSEPMDIYKDYGIKGTQTVITYTVYIGEKSLFTFRTFVYDIEDGQIKDIYNTQKKRYEKNTALYDALKTESRITLSLTEPEFDGDKPVTVEDFEYCTNSEGGITLKKYIGNSLFVTVPAEIDGLPVTEIGNDCFREWMAYFLTKVTVPDTVKRIGDRAFYCCEQLKSVDLPDGISIGADAFTGTPLAHLNPPAEITPEETQTHTVFNGLEKEFGKAVGEKEFIIGSEYTCLSSLKNIASTVTVTVPETVTKIDCGGGGGCTLIIKGAAEIVKLSGSYKTVIIENPNVKISPNAFQGTSIEALILPEGLTEIGEYAFAYAKIEKMTLPASVESIGKYAFVCFEGDVDVANASKLASVSELACIEGVASASLKEAIDNAVITDTNLDSEKYTQVLNKGYQINGSNLFIPLSGAYIGFEDDPDFRVFATREIIPSDGELQTINGGAYEKDGKIYFSFANGTDDVLLGIDIFANGENPQVSITSLYVGDTYGYGTINISHGSKSNKYGYVVRCSGKYSSVFEIPSYHGGFMMLDEYVGFYCSDVFAAAGQRIANVYITVDGGKTFTQSGNVAEYIFGGPVTGIAYPDAVLPNYRFVGSALPPSVAMDYLTKVTPANYDLYSAVQRSGYTHSIRTEAPVFEGDIGLCSHRISFADKSGNSHSYYMHTVSFDGGESWEVFEPHLFGSLPEHNICVSVDTCTDGGVTYEIKKGVLRIKGSEKIIMPQVAEYYTSAFSPSAILFDEGFSIDTSEEVPLYKGIFDASHDFYEIGDVTYVSYYGGEDIVEIPKTLKDQNGNEIEVKLDRVINISHAKFYYYLTEISYDKFDYYVSEKLTWFYWDNVLMFSTDTCKSISIYTFENNIDNVTWLADGSIYVVCRNGERFAEGTEYSAFCSTDGGHSFKKEDTVERENSYGLVINGKEYRVPIIKIDEGPSHYFHRADYKMYVDGKEAVLPKPYNYNYLNLDLTTMPYFDGDIGVWAYHSSYSTPGDLAMLLVSLDGGASWSLFGDNKFTGINYASWVYRTGK